MRIPYPVRALLRRRNRRRRSRRPVAEAWQAAIPGEVEFWDRWLKTGGSQWADDFAARLDPGTALQPAVANLIRGASGSVVRILDVGAGPVTFLGKTHPDHEIAITAVDALADDYNRSLDAAGIEPPVRTAHAVTEELTNTLAEAHFDIACARNTLDHSYDPIRAIREMVRCVTPGGAVLLLHYRNEAEAEDYIGLHQWNLMVEGPRYVVWRPGERHDLAAELDGEAVVESTSVLDDFEYVVLRRNS